MIGSDGRELARQAVVDTLSPSDFEGTAYDDLTQQAAELCKAEYAVISLVDGDVLHFRNRSGLHLKERPRASPFCEHAIGDPERVTVVEDAAADPRFSANPNVVGEPRLRFYVGVPLIVDGQPIGTLCAFDRRPHTVDQAQLEQLRFLADQVMAALEQRRRSGSQASGPRGPSLDRAAGLAPASVPNAGL